MYKFLESICSHDKGKWSSRQQKQRTRLLLSVFLSPCFPSVLLPPHLGIHLWLSLAKPVFNAENNYCGTSILLIDMGVGTYFSILSWRLPRHASEDPSWFGRPLSLKLTLLGNPESYENIEVPLKPHGWSGRTSSSQKMWEWMPNRSTTHFHMALSPISLQRRIAALLEILLQIGHARYTLSLAAYNGSMTFSLWSSLPGVKNIIACEAIDTVKAPAGFCIER